MKSNSHSIALLTAALLLVFQTSSGKAQPQMSVTRSAGGGPSAAALASTIGDPNSQYTVGSASVAINNANGADTDLRAIGTFSNGNVASGTSLQDPVDPNAVFAGGVGAASGVCLSTGFLSDNEPTAPSVPNPLRVGVQGANNGFPIDLVDMNGGV